MPRWAFVLQLWCAEGGGLVQSIGEARHHSWHIDQRGLRSFALGNMGAALKKYRCGSGSDVPFVYKGKAGERIPQHATRVRIHRSVKIIRCGAFSDCAHLAEVELNEGLEQIEDGAFESCNSLKRIKIPSTVKFIGERALQETPCSTVKTVGKGAFCACTQLVEVELCHGLQRIGTRSFYCCNSLQRVKIPSTVRSIGHEAFGHCGRLEQVELNEGMEYIQSLAFHGCKSLGSVNIPSTIKGLEWGVFDNCDQLERVELNEGLEYIQSLVFHGCTSLRSIKIPHTVTRHGWGVFWGVFQNCRQLVSVELCDDAERLGESAFDQCPSLRNVALPPTAQVSQCFSSKCYDLMSLLGSPEKINDALRSRFEDLPLHKICYYQSQHPTGAMLKELDALVGSTLDRREASPNSTARDCLGMTPLHILACSTKQNIELYRFIFANLPACLITEDEWGCLPIFYAIWVNAPREILTFLIERHRSAFPAFDLNWDKMIESLCRARAPLSTVQKLLGIQKTSFPEHSVDWRNAARALAIHCLLGCERSFDFCSHWEATVDALGEHHRWLLESLLELHQSLFPYPAQRGIYTDVNWQLVCEELVDPLKGWWRPSPIESLFTFDFLVKCRIADRLKDIRVRNWRMNICNMVENIRSIPNVKHQTHLHAVQSRLVSYEHEYRRLKHATFSLELALWKIKINESWGEDEDAADAKAQCRISCGAGIIIPNLLPYLISD